MGVFQQIIAGEEQSEALAEVIAMLRNTNHPQVDEIIKVMRKWAKDNRVQV